MKNSNNLTLNQLKNEVTSITNIDILNKMLIEEQRTGGKKIIQSQIKIMEKQQQMILNYESGLTYERQYDGEVICGVDEVGRGPLAGPVVACAAILNDDHNYLGLTDSKKLSKVMRSTLEHRLIHELRDYSIGIATVEEIDEINIYQASKLAMKRAVEGLTVKPTVLLIDAMELSTGLEEVSIIKGDEKSISIGAASVLAKEYRDRLMCEYHQEYPGYDFDKNAGYGTKNHLNGLKKHGITPIHRKTFEPIRSMLAF